MFEPHQGNVTLIHSFDEAWGFLRRKGEIPLQTDIGTPFTAKAGITRDGRYVIRYFQHGKEYGRSYECCWGRYYNCNRTRVGMYSKALDEAISHLL